VIDEETAEVVREAVRRVLAGETVNALCVDFNRRGILSPRHHQRVLTWLMLVRKSVSTGDGFECLVEVVGEGADGGDHLAADLDLDGAVTAGGADEFADGPVSLPFAPSGRPVPGACRRRHRREGIAKDSLQSYLCAYG
jgi:hypothetical protein